MLSLERKNLILRLVDKKMSASVGELAEKLGVSEVTIRKILNNMAHQGLLRRTRGGAVSLNMAVRETDQRTKEKTNTKQKKSIAVKAYGLIESYDTVFLDAGTTTLELVRQIKAGNKRDITVVTNSLDIAAEMVDSPDIEVILTGGCLRHGIRSCVGPIAENTAAQLRFDKAFIGANNISIKYGATTPNMLEAEIKKSVMDAAEKKYLLCDSSKFSGHSMTLISPLSAFTGIITDGGIDAETLDEAAQFGFNIIVNNS